MPRLGLTVTSPSDSSSFIARWIVLAVSPVSAASAAIDGSRAPGA